MASRLDELLDRIHRLEREVELNEARETWRYRIEAGRVRFERDVRSTHRLMKEGLLRFLRRRRILTVATASIIYAMAVPIARLDLSLSTYIRHDGSRSETR